MRNQRAIRAILLLVTAGFIAIYAIAGVINYNGQSSYISQYNQPGLSSLSIAPPSANISGGGTVLSVVKSGGIIISHRPLR